MHPGGNLGKQLKTVGDIMVSGVKIPFINENKNMKEALKIISDKKLGAVIVRNKNKITTGIITDGNVRKLRQKNIDFQKTKVKDVMTKDPITITSDSLAIKALRIMNEKKITSLCVIKGNISNKTTGVIHIHHILETNICLLYTSPSPRD